MGNVFPNVRSKIDKNGSNMSSTMPLPVSHLPQRNITVGLVAVPESSAAVTYGLHEVFSCVGTVWEALTGEKTGVRPMIPRIVGASREPMRTRMGATLVADRTFDEAFRCDIVIVSDLSLEPDARLHGRWPAAVGWLANQHANGAIVCSVCSGSLMLAVAGLLAQREATTHWSAQTYFRRQFPDIHLKPERVLVPSGRDHDVVTSGGSASWTDLALYLVARFCGDAEARRIAKIFLFGDRSGGQLPFAAMVRPPQHEDAVIAECQTWIAENYDCAKPVQQVTKKSGLTERTFKRRFQNATGYAPIDYIQTLRIEEAKQMLETTSDAVDSIAVSVGYEDPNSFRRLFKKAVATTPHEYRKRFQVIVPGAADAPDSVRARRTMP